MNPFVHLAREKDVVCRLELARLQEPRQLWPRHGARHSFSGWEVKAKNRNARNAFCFVSSRYLDEVTQSDAFGRPLVSFFSLHAFFGLACARMAWSNGKT